MAHYSEFILDDNETINFIHKCIKYGLSDDGYKQGIDIKAFVTIISQKMNDDDIAQWYSNINSTFESQKNLILEILYSNFIDAGKESVYRANSLRLTKSLKASMNDQVKTNLLEKHNHLLVIDKSKTTKSQALSRKFFEELGMLQLLNGVEQIAILKKKIQNLYSAHLGMNNFYTEPTFAEQLLISAVQINPLPKIVIKEYVDVVFKCYLDNNWGVATGAMESYFEILSNLTPQGIERLFENLLNSNTVNEIKIRMWKRENINRLLHFYQTNTGLLNSSQKNTLAIIINSLKVQ